MHKATPSLKGQRIVIYGMNYAPELIGVGKYSGELGSHFVNAGADVAVITTPPHYPGWDVQKPYRHWFYSCDHVAGARVTRCPLLLRRRMGGVWRLLAPLSFAVTSAPIALWQILTRRPQVVLAVEPTLFIAPMAVLAAKLVGARTVLHIQDLEIDAAFAMGHLRKRGLLSRVATAMEGWIMRRFDRVVSISDKMIEKVVEKGVPKERITLVRNWVDISHVFPLGASPYRAELGIPDGTSVVLYSGNIGAKQGLGVLLDAARALRDRKDITFVVAGEGPAKADLQNRYADLTNVRFLGLQPYERLNEFLNLADVHVIPQEKAAADLVLPSKLGGMLATGRPVVVTADHGTELANYLEGAASITAPGDAGALAMSLCETIDNVAMRGINPKRLALATKLSSHLALNRFSAELMENNASAGAVQPAEEERVGVSPAVA